MSTDKAVNVTLWYDSLSFKERDEVANNQESRLPSSPSLFNHPLNDVGEAKRVTVFITTNAASWCEIKRPPSTAAAAEGSK